MENPFVLDVGDLLTHPGEFRKVDFSAPLEVGIDHASAAGLAHVRARLEGLTNGVFLVGEAEAPVRLTCNR